MNNPIARNYQGHSPDRIQYYGQTMQSNAYLYDRSRTPNQQRAFGGTPLTIHNVSQSPSVAERLPSRKAKDTGLFSWKNSNAEEPYIQYYWVSFTPSVSRIPQRTLDKSPKSPSAPYHKELSLLHLNSKQMSQNQSNISTNNNTSSNTNQQMYAQIMSLSSERQKLLDEQRQHLTIIDTLQKNNFQLLQIVNSCARCHSLHREKFDQIPILSKVSLKDAQTQDNFYDEVISQLDQTNSHQQKVIKDLQLQVKGMQDMITQSELNSKLVMKLRERKYPSLNTISETLKDLVAFTERVIDQHVHREHEGDHFIGHLGTLEAQLKSGSKSKDAQYKTRLIPASLKAIQLARP